MNDSPALPAPDPPAIGFAVAPLGFVEKLDGAFGFLRRELPLMLGGAAALVLPPALAAQLVSGRTTAWTVLSADPANDPTGTGATSGWQVLGSLTFSLWLSLGTCALGVYAGLLLRARLGREDVTMWSLLGGTVRRLPGTVGAWVLHLLVYALMVFTCGTGLILAATFMLVVGPVIGMEDSGWRGFGRSASLAGSRFFPTLGVVAASTLLTLMLALVPRGVVVLVAQLLYGVSTPDWLWVVDGAVGFVSSAAAGAVAASVALVAYVDLRCRREGWDLLSRMATEFPPPRGAGQVGAVGRAPVPS
ncbi:MAG: hypothetical protein R2754_01235 [Microthrixaceae bacterium]